MLSLTVRSAMRCAGRGIHAQRPAATVLRAMAFSTEAEASAIKAATSMVNRKLLIDGKFVDSVSGKTLPVIDPRTEKVVTQVPAAQKEDIDRAVKAARKAFDEGPWPRMGGKARASVLLKLADLVEKHAKELGQLESLDNGKPVLIAEHVDVRLVVSNLRYFAGWADKIHGSTIPVDGNFFAYTLHEPIGVVGQIVPWNFPLLMMAWKICPALAAGNTVVIKVAEQTPLTALRLGQLALEAGLPAGVLNVITGYGEEAGAPLASHPLVDKVAFTGSTEVGRLVGVAAAKNITPCTLELGGKSPLIVDKDVDLDKAVAIAHMGLFFNGGQVCTAGSRVFVHEAVYDEFVAKASTAAQQRKVGDPFVAGTDQGPQVDDEQFKKVMRYIELGKKEGAKLMTGGNRIGSVGYFVEPTVFADCKDDMSIFKEEIFGPVQSISKFSSLSEVTKRANNSPYGLAAGVMSNNVHTINALTRNLQAGTVWVNCYNSFDPSMPFGGYKDSGIGRDGGAYALSHYTKVKAVYQAMPEATNWM